MALGALTAVHEEGFAIPGLVSILGFDDTAGEHSHPQLSSVSLPKREMGSAAASLLIDGIKGKRNPPRCIRVTPTLVLRQSTDPAPLD